MQFRFLLLKPIIILLGIIAVGTAGYMFIENWNFLDSLFMSVETLTTVGYGLFNELSVRGEIFTIIYILFGVILFLYLAADFAEKITNLDVQKLIDKKNMEKRIKSLKDHYILCGYGRTGIEIATQLKNSNIDFIIIDKNPEIENEALQIGAAYITGDATNDDVLEKAGIYEAKGLFCALSDDVDNLYLTLSAKNLNPKLKVVTRCIKASNEHKFKKAGAKTTILPYEISGRRMVASIIKPEVVDFLDVVMHAKGAELELQMEQYYIKQDSKISGKTLASSGIRDKTGIIIIAIKRGHTFITNPSASTVLESGDCLIVLGTIEQLINFEKFADKS